MLFHNTYYILCTIQTISLGVTYYPLETIEHNHQNWTIFLDSFVDSIIFYSTIEYL
jgi:hypothetical protein